MARLVFGMNQSLDGYVRVIPLPFSTGGRFTMRPAQQDVPISLATLRGHRSRRTRDRSADCPFLLRSLEL